MIGLDLASQPEMKVNILRLILGQTILNNIVTSPTFNEAGFYNGYKATHCDQPREMCTQLIDTDMQCDIV